MDLKRLGESDLGKMPLAEVEEYVNGYDWLGWDFWDLVWLHTFDAPKAPDWTPRPI